MNPLYKAIAKAIRMNTLKNTTEVVDKDGLVEALMAYFKETDSLFRFSADEFKKACKEIEEA